jgi:serine phosphatase RsbU (regulator of sigma subunit)
LQIAQHTSAVRERLRRALIDAAIVAIIIAPLIAGSIWIYTASAAAFGFQHNLRVAQNARAGLIRAFLATESDVRGFAATGDAYFATAYRSDVRSFSARATDLLNAMRDLDVSSGDRLVSREKEAFTEWNRIVAQPILNGHHGSSSRLLRSVDPGFAKRILADDDRAIVLLDDVSAAFESRRQELLHRILLASIALVASVTAVIVFLILNRAAAERRVLKQAVLYNEERRVSEMLQLALAPESLPFIEGVRLNAIYVPAALERHVGGDWYDVVELRDGRILLLIGDVAGHGLAAAVVMNRARQAILAAAARDSDPARILQNANRSLTARTTVMLTAACCVFDPHTMDLIYATAGHPPPIIAPAAGLAFALSNGGPPLGIESEIELYSAKYAFEPGSMLVLYTDGLIEERRDIFASERALIEAVQHNRESPAPAAEIFAALLPDDHPRDDVAILTARFAAEG